MKKTLATLVALCFLSLPLATLAQTGGGSAPAQTSTDSSAKKEKKAKPAKTKKASKKDAASKDSSAPGK